MNPERFARLRELVLTLPRLSAGERRAYLDQVCADDSELRREAESLLAWDTGLPELVHTGGIPERLGLPPASDFAPPPLPERIGPYRIRGVLGRGGMGIVYRAQQIDPIQREVAIKLIGTGLDRQQVLARFEAERQTLAVMEHPAIARVLDAGEDEEGKPYFVMELVRGVPITEYCRENALPIEDRLALFRDVCFAVQHAHQKGIIHRDLKPSNLLVTTMEKRPTPKVIDFGIAKALGEVTPEGAVTHEGQLMGTLEYMSPEQAGARPGEVDTRSDVYSLGVVLYELLTGELPYETKGKGIVEAARIIAQEVPRPPRGLRGDLATILLKALEKEPDHRYATAAALAEDLERYNLGMPILAHPPSTIYQLTKMVSRHRSAFFLGGALIILTIVFAITMTVLFQAQRVQRARAQAEAEKARQVSTFLREMLSSVESQGESATVREILDAAARDVGAEFSHQPEIQATLRSTIGSAYAALQMYDVAEPHLRAALDIRRRIFGERHPEVAASLVNMVAFLRARGPDREGIARIDSLAGDALAMLQDREEEDHPEVINALGQLAQCRTYMERFASADSLYRIAIARARRSMGREHPRVASLLFGQADALQHMAKWPEATANLREALSIFRRAYPGAHSATAACLRALGTLTPEPGEAESLLIESLAMSRDLWGEGHVNTVEALNDLGVSYTYGWRFDEAEPLLREALAIVRGIYAEDHSTVVRIMNNLAVSLGARGDYQEAEPLYRHALNVWSQKRGPGAVGTLLARTNLADVVSGLGRHEEACALCREGLALVEEGNGSESPMAALHHHRLATFLHRCGRYEEAVASARQALSIRQRVGAGDLPFSMEILAQSLQSLGRLEEAEALYLRADSIHCCQGELPRRGIGNRVGLGSCLRELGRVEEANDYLRSAWQRFVDLIGENHPGYAGVTLELGALCVETGDWEEARRLLEACAVCLDRFAPASDSRRPRLQRLLEQVEHGSRP